MTKMRAIGHGVASPKRGPHPIAGLCVGHNGVCLLSIVSRDKTVAVCGFGGFHGCWATAEFLEHGSIPVLAPSLIPLEDDASFEFSVRLIMGKF